jgi:hypothetical protein
MDTATRGRATFRVAAVLFMLSAAFELAGIGGETPLFGTIVGGVVAAAYHLLYATLFALLAAGLWNGRRFGYYAVFAATVLYSIDRLQFVAWRDTMLTFMRRRLAGQEALLEALGTEYVLQVLTVVSAVAVLCWWGFAAYAWYRRAYFGVGAQAGTAT